MHGEDDRRAAGIDSAVRAQYEAYPYPARDPRDESRRLIIGSPSDLREIDHYIFAGRRDPARPFRALVAGGGTGDAFIMLAQQLADAGTPGEVVYLDASAAAREVAEARARARGLGNTRFATGSLLDLSGHAPGPFDYIDCCGVLHHLDDPLAGLKTLSAALAPEGGMGLMLYAPFGRSGVYEMQEMLRVLSPVGEPPRERIGVARRLLDALPPTNLLRRNPFVRDHLDRTDAGLYDLLLHPRDRAFTVAEIAALCAEARLRIAAFIEPIRYEPATWLAATCSTDRRIGERLARLPWLERCAFAERLAGSMRKHVFYAVPGSRTGSTVAAPDRGAAIPLLREIDGQRLARTARAGKLTANLDGLKLDLPLPPLAPAIIARIDGRRSLDEIFAGIAETMPGTARTRFDSEFRSLYAVLNGLNKLVLRFPAA